jgi:hypothetical protein
MQFVQLSEFSPNSETLLEGKLVGEARPMQHLLLAASACVPPSACMQSVPRLHQPPTMM